MNVWSIRHTLFASFAAVWILGIGFESTPACSYDLPPTHKMSTNQSPVVMMDDLPTTGTPLPAMHAFDETILTHIKEHNLPGAAVAVIYRGRLVYARGYGYSDLEAKTPVQPTTQYRLASVSKPITATAIMTLVEDPKIHLDLNTKAFPLLGLKPFLKQGQREDPRIWDITIRQLLNHAGGWDRDKSGDIMFKVFQISRDLGIKSPPDHQSIIRWGMGQPLDFAPGQRYAYSNFGYLVLGRIIEKLTGTTYEKYVQEHVLFPAGVKSMRIGMGHRSERFPNEAVYYAASGRSVRSVYSGEGLVPQAYGFETPETMDAHGGWVGSPIDLMRLSRALENRGDKPLLAQSSLDAMLARPNPPLNLDSNGAPSAIWYGLGWQARTAGRRLNSWHTGSMPGTATIWVRLGNGLSWAILTNRDDAGDIDGLMHKAAATVKSWPDQDLFDKYPS